MLALTCFLLGSGLPDDPGSDTNMDNVPEDKQNTFHILATVKSVILQEVIFIHGNLCVLFLEL